MGRVEPVAPVKGEATESAWLQSHRFLSHNLWAGKSLILWDQAICETLPRERLIHATDYQFNSVFTPKPHQRASRFVVAGLLATRNVSS